MNSEFAEQINPFLENFKFAKALDIAETALKKIPTTDFHQIIGKSLISQTDRLTSWVDDFYKTVSKKINVKALYFEMIEFDINVNVWDINGFAYDMDGGLYLNDMDWVCDFTTETMTAKAFIIKGYEKLQDCFGQIDCNNQNLIDARDWCEQIIITRFMELMRAAHLKAKEKSLVWAKIPLYFTEHDYDFIVRSTN